MKSTIFLSAAFALLLGAPVQSIQAAPVSMQTPAVTKGAVSIEYDTRSETLYVKLNAPTDKGRVTIVVYNKIGKVVVKEVMKNIGKPERIKLDLAGVESGIYKVVVELPNSDFSDRFVKK